MPVPARTPGLPPQPAFEGWRARRTGALQAFRTDPLEACRRFGAECGPVWTLLDWWRRIVVVQDPELAHELFTRHHRAVTKSFGYELLRPMLGNGLLTAEGDFWRKQRRLMQPAFHKEAMAALAGIMQEEADRCADGLLAAADRGEAVDVSAAMNRTTMAIVARSLLGGMVPGDMDRISRHLDWLNRDVNHRIMHPLQLPLWMPTPRNRAAKRRLEALLELIRRFIARRRASAERGTDLLSMLVDLRDADTGEGMSDRQLQDEVATIFVAGHETTANAMAWALYALARHPEAARYLERGLEAHPATQGREDPAGLPEVRHVARETLRVYPPAWVVGRATAEPLELGPWRLPAGVNLLVPTLALQRDAAWWPDPDAFRPERHADAAAEAARPKGAYLPFGAGPRICIGLNMAWMEMHILLPTLWRRLRFRAEGSVGLQPLITLHPDRPIVLRPERAPAASAVGA